MQQAAHDDNARVEAIAGALAAGCGAEVDVHGCARLPGGACQDNFAVDVTFGAGARDGAEALAGRRRLVLRSDAARSLPGSIARRDEARVIAAARDAGVRTPAARFASEGLLRPGASAVFLDWVEGIALGRKVVAAPELHAARATLPEALAEELGKIHRVGPSSHPTLFDGVGARAGGAGGQGGEAEAYGLPRQGDGVAAFDLDPVASALDGLDLQVERLVEPHPALAWVARWLRRHAPDTGHVVLVHGDFRVGNFLVDAHGLSAILDWEFAHFGAVEEDLAWIAVRDWRFGRLDLPVGGLCRRARFAKAYEAASGRRVDGVAVHWWEVMGNARWAAGAVQQAERVLSGQERDLEFVALGRRAAEMEWEALRLIERGPEGDHAG